MWMEPQTEQDKSPNSLGFERRSMVERTWSEFSLQTYIGTQDLLFRLPGFIDANPHIKWKTGTVKLSDPTWETVQNYYQKDELR